MVDLKKIKLPKLKKKTKIAKNEQTSTPLSNSKGKKKKLSKSALILIIGISIVAIPCLVFAGILGVSWLQTGSPRLGRRFSDDLVTKISNSEVKDVEADISTISGVEDVDVVLAQGQLKIYVDTIDSLTSDDVDRIIADAYTKVTTKLPISTYFTKTDTAKMYDLHIHVYTSVDAANREYKLLHKNSSEEQFSIDDLAHPKDQNLVNELNGLNITDEQPEDIDEENGE